MARASGRLLLQRGDDVEAVAVAEPQIDDREGRRGLADLRETVRDGVAGRDRKAAGLHGARQALQKRLVVLHDEQRAVSVFVQFGDGVQGSKIPVSEDKHMACDCGAAKTA